MINSAIAKLPQMFFRKLMTGQQRHRVMQPARQASLTGEKKQGQVFIVGAGPGDAELLTIKAWKCLQQADVVLFDWLVDESVIAEIPRHVKTEFVGKRAGKHSMVQDDICKRVVELAQSGLNVVRLKGGDPAVFARTCEETAALEAADIPFAIVPGITAASGASAYTGIPLTERNCAQSVTLTTASFKDKNQMPDWATLADTMQRQTVVVYMGLSRLSKITSELVDAGIRETLPVAVIENACTPNQQVITGTVSSIAEQVTSANLQGPALLIFGEVVKSRQQVSTALLQQVTHVAGI
ncbi:uroporphyrinogen-III C-methyltransferase [Alteromonas sp. 1_MG-2023]|uniref:uroporphyrinogen-III C-methyltransferase n=1 Tax=Alteromonas sp. 1_MG-2023 TaxID=3062669 RepID=UPI0026E4883D|nr:uroporphyrinogen-III C-methyltransferase [Alteromonas sp. 1_MG-2023]MDO6475788.1 uroporphyrinogen-III C-methyltransferase [Alteromonas sp. 1_MG-2023]